MATIIILTKHCRSWLFEITHLAERFERTEAGLRLRLRQILSASRRRLFLHGFLRCLPSYSTVKKCDLRPAMRGCHCSAAHPVHPAAVTTYLYGTSHLIDGHRVRRQTGQRPHGRQAVRRPVDGRTDEQTDRPAIR